MILQSETHDLDTPTGAMRTYLYRPVAAGRYPGLVLFSEIFQQTGPIQRTAALMAGHGFVVAVPEIFHELETPGAVLAYDQAGADRGNRDKTSKSTAAYDDDAGRPCASSSPIPRARGSSGRWASASAAASPSAPP